MSIAVRIAQAADADGISRVILAALHSSNARDYPADVIARVAGNFTPDAVLELLRRRSVLVAVQDEVIVATASLDGTFNTVTPASRARNSISIISSRPMPRSEEHTF